MDHYKQFEKLEDASLRIEKIIYLAGAMSAICSFSDDLYSFFDDEDEETIKRCFGDIPEYIEFDGRSHEWCSEVFDWLVDQNKLGFLVQFATPIMEPSGNGKYRSFSWGHYRTYWVYSETVNKAIQQGMRWTKECRKKVDQEASHA